VRTWLALAVMAVMVVATSARADKGFTDCTTRRELLLDRGESLKVNCDRALVLNPVAYKELLDQRASLEKLPGLVDESRKNHEALVAKQQQLIAELKGMNETQGRYYEALRAKYVEVDKIAVESVENTRTALRLAQGARLSSYLTAGVLGGLGGGLGGSQVGGRGGMEIGAGVLLGALAGVGINWALLHIMGVQ